MDLAPVQHWSADDVFNSRKCWTSFDDLIQCFLFIKCLKLFDFSFLVFSLFLFIIFYVVLLVCCYTSVVIQQNVDCYVMTSVMF